jgi:hypothetical protein
VGTGRVEDRGIEESEVTNCSYSHDIAYHAEHCRDRHLFCHGYLTVRSMGIMRRKWRGSGVMRWLSK